ncbi:MAG: hypothetical protein WC076_01020 [Terrimicrobiaceae bacterium]|jgi:hypothetical protein|nr:hypothetical protein [Terrimicrobiaceae bacterium]
MSPKSARQFLAIHPPETRDSRKAVRARDALAKSPVLFAEYEAQAALDRETGSVLAGLEVPPAVIGELDARVAASAAHGKRRFNPRDPAMLAVAIGFLLLVVLLAWHFLGRAGVFPEEALTIAAEGAKLRTEQFEVVEEKAGALDDWFVLKGFDRFHIPARFANYQAAGARIFKAENRPVAVLAIPENYMFFLIFDPAPLGIGIHPEGSWQFTEFDYKYAAAIREEKGMCFMIVIKGTSKDLARLVENP